MAIHLVWATYLDDKVLASILNTACILAWLYLLLFPLPTNKLFGVARYRLFQSICLKTYVFIIFPKNYVSDVSLKCNKSEMTTRVPTGVDLTNNLLIRVSFRLLTVLNGSMAEEEARYLGLVMQFRIAIIMFATCKM